jgi:choline kinase
MERSKPKTLLIMAGGLGSRYQGLKQVDAILESGETLLEFSIYDAILTGFDKIILILNKKIEHDFIKKIENICHSKNVAFGYVFQEINMFVPEKFTDLVNKRQKPWGTAHAILCAKNIVNEPFVAVNADDFYGRKTFEIAVDAIDSKKIDDYHYQMIAFKLKSTLSKNGSVSRGICMTDRNRNLIKIEEHTDILEKENLVISIQKNEILDEDSLTSMNFWCFGQSIFEYIENKFLLFLENVKTEKQEFYIPSLVQELIVDNKIEVKIGETTSQWFGMTYPEDKILLQTELQKQIKNGLYHQKLWT